MMKVVPERVSCDRMPRSGWDPWLLLSDLWDIVVEPQLTDAERANVRYQTVWVDNDFYAHLMEMTRRYLRDTAPGWVKERIRMIECSRIVTLARFFESCTVQLSDT